MIQPFMRIYQCRSEWRNFFIKGSVRHHLAAHPLACFVPGRSVLRHS